MLELLAGLFALVFGKARLEPLAGDAVVAARLVRRHELQHRIVLEVVLEDVLGVARHRRVGHLEEVIALDQLLERRLDAHPIFDGEDALGRLVVESMQDHERVEPEDDASVAAFSKSPRSSGDSGRDARLDRLLDRHRQRRLERALRIDAPFAGAADGGCTVPLA